MVFNFKKMVRTCLICKKRDDLDPEVCFRAFPVNRETRDVWLSIFGMENGPHIPKRPTLCSDHFSPNDIVTRANGQRQIHLDALPLPNASIFVEPSSSSSEYSDSDSNEDLPSLISGTTPEEYPSVQSTSQNQHHSILSAKTGFLRSDSPKSMARQSLRPIAPKTQKLVRIGTLEDVFPNFVPPTPYITQTEKGNPVLIKIGTIANLPKNLRPSNQEVLGANENLSSVTVPNHASQKTMFILPKIVKVETVEKVPIAPTAYTVQEKQTEENTFRTLTVDSVKDLSTATVLPYEEIKSENNALRALTVDNIKDLPTVGVNPYAKFEIDTDDSLSDSSATDSASEIENSQKLAISEVEEEAITSETIAETGSNSPEIKTEQYSSSASDTSATESANEIEDASSILMPEASVVKAEPNTLVQKIKAEQYPNATSISEEQLIELLESESPLLTPELLFDRRNPIKRNRFFGDITEDDFDTVESKKMFSDAKIQINKDRMKIRSLTKQRRRLKQKIEKITAVVNYLAEKVDVSDVKKVLEGENDEEIEDSNHKTTSHNSDNEESNGATLNETHNQDDTTREENETEVNSFDLANQVQVTFSAGNDTKNESILKKDIKQLAGKDINKSKKIKNLVNTIFMKNKIIDSLKREIDKLTSQVT